MNGGVSDADRAFNLSQNATDLADELAAIAGQVSDFARRCSFLPPDLEILILAEQAKGEVEIAIQHMMSAANKLRGYGEALQS